MKSWNGLDEAAAAQPAKPSRPSLKWRALSATFVTLVMLAALDTIFPSLRWVTPFFNDALDSAESTIPGYGFKWSEITPKEFLEFHECYHGFQCARLIVPLDPLNGSFPGETVSLAITKLPARVPVNDPRYGGPILLNPGGPGGMGSVFAVEVAESLQLITDSDFDPNKSSGSSKYYDIIGFDPRGVGFTTPVASCMPNQPSEWSWALREFTEGLLGSSDAALGRLWSMTHAYGTSCKQAADQEDGPDIKQYVSTAFVARDMLEIVEKHAEYVEKERNNLSKVQGGNYEAVPGVHNAKLNYWGFSYGTILGSTFASMFPDRVGHVILDGVVSSYDYRNSLGNGSLTDTEKAMESFFTYCQAVGPNECPLTVENGTASDVKVRFNRILQSLLHHPIPVVTDMGPDIWTWSELKLFIFGSLYAPQGSFSFIAAILAAIEVGYGDALDSFSMAFRYFHTYSCAVDDTGPPVPHLHTPTFAILCGDGIDQTYASIDEFATYWHLLDSMAPSAGSYWSMFRMRCAAWKIRASYAFEGPFGGKTANPILFISNTADPVTPLRSGRLMHSMFEESALLIQDSAGHCSIALATPCTLAHIKAYFQSGFLPAPNTVCVPPTSPYSLNSTDPKSPFFDPSLDADMAITMRVEDFDLHQTALYAAGREAQRRVAASDSFAFQSILGAMKAGHALKMAAKML